MVTGGAVLLLASEGERGVHDGCSIHRAPVKGATYTLWRQGSAALPFTLCSV